MEKLKLFHTLLLFMACGVYMGWSQNYTTSGTIKDDHEMPMIGAYILVQSQTDSIRKGTSTNTDGKFTIGELKNGSYTITVTYLGYKDQVYPVTINNGDVEGISITMVQDPKNLNQVIIEEEEPRVKMNGDTTEYNADSYKVNQDATAQDLLNKMPGMTTQNGTPYAQGEEVKKVLVDGKEFFGDDPNIALKNIPADMIDKIQVYDKTSDQAEFTGFKDGNTSKTINIITKEDKRNGVFGKVYAGAGITDKYSAGITLNYFNNNQRITLLGIINNVNEQNFSSQDILGISSGSRNTGGAGGAPGGGGGNGNSGPPQGGPPGSIQNSTFYSGSNSGMNTTYAAGLNYTDTWGKKWNVNGNYFFNHVNNTTETTTNREYFQTDTTTTVYSENNTSESTNANHRLNMRMEYTIDSSNSLIITPAFSYQENYAVKSILSTTGYENGTQQNNQENTTTSDRNGFNSSLGLLYRHQFRKPGRTISASLNLGATHNNAAVYLNSSTRYYDIDSTVQNQQLTLNQTRNYSLSSNISYTEPLGKITQLMISYQPSFSYHTSDKNTSRYDSLNAGYTQMDTTLSNHYDFITTAHRGGLAFNINLDKIYLSAGADYQFLLLDGSQVFPYTLNTSMVFHNVLPSANFDYHISQRAHFGISYFTNTQAPSVTQLQNVIDNSNTVQLTTGNPDLKQQYTHSVMARFRRVNRQYTHFLMGFMMYNYSDSYIANSVFTATTDTILSNGTTLYSGSQLSKPVNMGGYHTLRSMLMYGFPLKFIKSNANLNAGFNYVRLPGYTNDVINYSNTYTINGGITLGSNISERVDFTLNYTAGYNFVKNTVQAASNQNYYSGIASFKFNVTPVKHLVLSSDVTYTHYIGLTGSYNPNIVLWNAGIAYKFLKDDVAEIKIYAYDLLNQNNSIARTVNNTYVEDTQTNVLKRYFLLTFTYNFKFYGK